MLRSLFKNYREIFLYLFIIVWYIVKNAFYQYVDFPNALYYSHFSELFAAVMLIICFKDVINTRVNGYVSYIAIGVIISFLISIFFWDASPFYELQAQGTSVGLLYVVVYFAMRKWKVESKTVEYILITITVIYLACWLYSLYKMPELIFGADRDNEYGEITERGFYRLFIPGNTCAVMTFFFLGQFLKNKKKWALAMYLIMIVVVILHVGRQMIVWTIISSAIMIYMHYKKHILYLVLAAILSVTALFYVASEIPAVSSMIELSQDQSDDFENDIRMDAVNFYINSYPHDIITSIWGNGVPARETDLFKIDERGIRRGYYQTDVGFIAMFCNYGLWGVCFCLLLLWRIINLKIDPRYEYLKYYIYYLYGVYLMSQGLTNSFFVFMLAYYILENNIITNNNTSYRRY